MGRRCHHCGKEETDDAVFCSHCRGRLDVSRVFDGSTPSLYDEHAREPPYIVWVFPYAFLETAILTKDEFLARTLLVIIWLALVFFFLGLIAGSVIAAVLLTGLITFLWYLMWKNGRKEAKTGYW